VPISVVFPVAAGDEEMLDDTTESDMIFPALNIELLALMNEIVELFVAVLVDSEMTVTVVVLFWLRVSVAVAVAVTVKVSSMLLADVLLTAATEEIPSCVVYEVQESVYIVQVVTYIRQQPAPVT
jgi:hypothetical protein